MKIKKMGLYAWALVAAMIVSMLPINAVSVKAAAAKILDANTLQEGTEYTSEEPVKVGDFSYVAKADKPITVKPCETPKKATDGKEFTQWIKFQGGACQIRFDMAANEKVKVYYTSGGSDEREVGFYSSATAELVDKKPAPSNEGDVAIAEFTAKEAGEYYIASVTKSMQVYYIQVGEAEAEQPKTEVKAETETKAETPIVPTGNTYTVQKGDTLCSIARRLFNAEAKWSDLYNWNKATIKDPALIYIGQVLSINGETVSAPVETTTPSQAATATAEPTLKYSVDVDGLKEVPAELASYFVVASQWDRNIMKFAEKTTRAVLPMTATTGNVKLEMEMNPAGKTAQSIIFKNSAGEQVLVIGNNIGNKTIVDGTYYFTDTVAEMYSDEAATAVKSLQDIAVFPKNTWLKLTIEIDTAKSEAKVTVIGYPEASKYSDDYSVWTNLGEATYTFTNSKADIAGIEIQSTDNARFVGDIALTY